MKRILIVDDDARIVERLTTLLSDKYEILTASTGFDALKCVDVHKFDLVLLDLRMPGLDGAGFVREIQTRRIPIPIVLMSANPNLADQARVLGIPLFLAKPFEIERLEAIVEQL